MEPSSLRRSPPCLLSTYYWIPLMSARIYGIQAAQDAMLRMAAAVKPNGGLAEAVKEATIYLHRYAVTITHVRTGALRASHHIELRGRMGAIYINPGAVRSDGGRPSVYGPIEHARGGAHAFYARTIAEAGQRAAQAGYVRLRGALP